MSDGVARALDALVTGFVTRTRDCHGRLPRQPFDGDWLSPCQQGEPDAQGNIAWEPVLRTPRGCFAGLEAALEVPLPAAWVTFFGRYWSDGIPVSGLSGKLELLQLWNDADEERLVANQLGHVLQRRRRKLPATLFFACAEDADLLYSVDIASGAVLREVLARNEERFMAESLDVFLDGLEAIPGD